MVVVVPTSVVVESPLEIIFPPTLIVKAIDFPSGDMALREFVFPFGTLLRTRGGAREVRAVVRDDDDPPTFVLLDATGSGALFSFFVLVVAVADEEEEDKVQARRLGREEATEGTTVSDDVAAAGVALLLAGSLEELLRLRVESPPAI